MSVYKKIQTEIKNPDSLTKALTDLGLNAKLSPDLRQNSVELWSSWYNLGGRGQNVAIAVNRSDIEDAGYSAMDGIGFVWNGSSYDLVYDHMDEEGTSGGNLINRIKQRYTVNEAKHLAALQGYTITEENLPDGTVNLLCTGYSY